MLKKIFTLALAAMLATALVVSVSAAGINIGQAELEEFATSVDGGTTLLQNSGGGGRDMDGGVLWFVGRSNDYDAIDIRIFDSQETLSANVPDGDYTITANLTSDAPANFGFKLSQSPWGNIVMGDEGTTGNTTISMNFSVVGGKAVVTKDDGSTHELNSIRIQEDNVVDFGLISVSVLPAGGGGGGGAAAVVDTTWTAGDKGDVKTGVADVTVASAIALVAAGAVVFSRKKK